MRLLDGVASLLREFQVDEKCNAAFFCLGQGHDQTAGSQTKVLENSD